MAFLPPQRLMIRLSHPCPYVAEMPQNLTVATAPLLNLPNNGIIHPHAALEGQQTFAELRLGWNERGLGVEAVIRGKRQPLQGDQTRPGSCDGVHLWLATRPAGTSRRATRYCFHFVLLATGCGSERDQPGVTALRIPRAVQETPLPDTQSCLIRRLPERSGGRYDYRLHAFLPAVALPGYDPVEVPTLGFFFLVRDHELGDQFLAFDWNFPISEDPALWDQLELVR
ncbi:MAG: hypothetical protein NZU63_03660 [Gemmataceae bacterium]|nr:hypothetical protein [Gemmataceae bacterium]MDW8242712.1 hypothetical protein [Thermogemmata sp.]